MQYKSYGQKDTTVVRYNDSVVIVQKQTAIQITKDLLKKDILEEEVAYLKKDTALLLKQIEVYKKDSVISDKKEKAHLSIISSYNKSLINCEQYAINQHKQLKKSKAKSTISQILLIAVSVFTISKL